MDRPDPPPPAPPPPGGDDGVRITGRPRRRGGGRMLGLALIAVVAGVVGWRLLAARTAAQTERRPTQQAQARVPDSTPGPGGRSTGLASASVAHRPPPPSAATREGEDPTPDLSDYVLPGEAPTMAEVIQALHERGIRSGLGAFPPPGTSPPLLGLEVPEGFVLPEGYVRHHQATDDGQRIAPILMFHPDLTHVEVGGRRVPVPADRVVTPELAPPGMPLRRVRIPPPRDGGGGP